MQIVEDAAALEVGSGVLQQVFADRLKQRVAGGDPLKGWVLGQELLVEDNVFVLVAKFAEAGFEPFANGPKLAGDPADAIDFRVVPGFLGLNAGRGGGLDEEVFDDLGHEAAFLGLGGFADDGTEIQLPLGEAFEG